MKSHPFLDSLARMRSPMALEPLHDALSEVGSPHEKMKCVQVTGTNGKGSTAAMIANGLKSCGLFTSPHLTVLNERVQIDAEFISDGDLNTYAEKLRPTILKHELSFFEAMTLLALCYFADKACDYAVMEVGMGGRLDATSVCHPLVSVITNIDLDHTQHLGGTIPEIAREKAGVVKSGTVVTSERKPEALEVIRAKAQAEGVALVLAEKENLSLELRGSYQQDNAACALEALRVLGVSRESARKAVETAQWPGRLEQVGDVLFDCAHNPAAMRSLATYMRGKEFTLVIAMKRDKDFETAVSIIAPLAKKVIVTQYTNGPKPLPAADLYEAVKNHTPNSEIVENARAALKKANGLTVVTGSIFLVGELRP